MRIAAFSLLGLLLLSVVYSSYLNKTAPSRIMTEPGDVIHPEDDPVKVVAGAREAMLNVRQPYRCKFEWPGRGTRLKEISTLEIADREHYRWAAEKRAGALVQKEDEMIMVGGEAYRRKAEGPWQQLTSSELEWWQQKVGPPLLGTTFDADDENPQFHFQGRQLLGSVKVYEYSAVEPGKTVSYLIGVKDGLPYETRRTLDSKDIGRSEMIATCTFGPVTIRGADWGEANPASGPTQ